MPPLGTHAREHGIVMYAGVVDQYLNRSLIQNRCQRRPGCISVCHVEGDGSGAPTALHDLAHGCRGGLNSPMRMDINMVAVACQTLADSSPDRATTACHQRSSHIASGLSNAIAARPLSSTAPSA